MQNIEELHVKGRRAINNLQYRSKTRCLVLRVETGVHVVDLMMKLFLILADTCRISNHEVKWYYYSVYNNCPLVI